MTFKTGLFILLGIISFSVSLLIKKNRKRSDEIRKRMLDKVSQVKDIETFKSSSDYKSLISNSIITLLEDFDVHQQVAKKMNNQEIQLIKKKLNLNLPNSYKIFLKYFGDGAYWIYFQTIDQIQNYSWLKDYRDNLGETLQLNKETIDVDSLLCLMSEDSNGGAWCWLTFQQNNDGEWPLAYYSISDKKLHYKVKNFTEWLKILTETKYEVIRELDIDEKLGLG